jgi:hypothetical protein
MQSPELNDMYFILCARKEIALTMPRAWLLKVKWLAGGRFASPVLALQDTDGRLSVQSAHVTRVRRGALHWRHHVCNTHTTAPPVTSFIRFLLVHFSWRYTCKLWRGYRRLRTDPRHRAQNSGSPPCVSSVTSIICFLRGLNIRFIFLQFLAIGILFFIIVWRYPYTLMMVNHH